MPAAGAMRGGATGRGYLQTAPVGGWNARDALASMKETEARTLDNWFPGYGKVETRRGFASYATGLGGTVRTIAAFDAGTSQKLIAGANGNLWNITAAGAGSSLASGFTVDTWQVAQFDDASGGARLGLVNGTDAPQIYNGSTVAAMTVSGSGLTVTTLVGIHIHKNRSFFWANNSQDFWYSSTGALGGVLTKFPLGRLSGFGGNLAAMGTWTLDGGSGVDDLAVFVMSSGDVLVYAGDDPGTAAAWALQGIYRVGAPLSSRCLVKLGGELILLTKAGIVPLSQALRIGESRQGVAITDRIRGAVLYSAQNYGSNTGWQGVLYPRGNYLLFNVPQGSVTFHQYVLNTETGAWCRFTGQNAYCWGVSADGLLYFGGTGGVVYLADSGYSDAGAVINAEAKSAWTYLGARGRQKRVGLVRVVGRALGGSVPYSLAVSSDFRESTADLAGASTVTAGGAWDTSSWDVTDWPTEAEVFDGWAGAAGIGDAFSTTFRVASSQAGFEWFSTSYVNTPGGLL